MKTEILEKKITSIILNEGWKNFQDIHIDELYDSLIPNERIRMGIDALSAGSRMIDEKIDLLLAFSLKRSIREKKELTINILDKALDYSPPSIYVFPKNYLPFKKSLELSSLIDVKGESRVVFFLRNDENIVYSKLAK